MRYTQLKFIHMHSIWYKDLFISSRPIIKLLCLEFRKSHQGRITKYVNALKFLWKGTPKCRKSFLISKNQAPFEYLLYVIHYFVLGSVFSSAAIIKCFLCEPFLVTLFRLLGTNRKLFMGFHLVTLNLT